MSKQHTSFKVTSENQEFMASVQKTLVQQPDYTGHGGHGLEDSEKHGSHSQASIGLDSTTVNFRRRESK